MIKGPKAILSSAIANALGEYFVVDANAIESNLLKDAKIVLRRVKLKEQVTRIPLNSAGKSTVITTTGSVEEVSFTWAWSVGNVVWVNDAVLTIVGAKFQARLEHEERHNDEDDVAVKESTASDAAGGGKTKDRREAFVNRSTIDAASARKIKESKGGLGGFVERQVKMVMDMLTLKMVDFELRIVLPHQPQEQQEGVADDVGSSATKDACNKVLAVGVDKIEVLSFGRDDLKQGDGAAIIDTTSLKKLKQRISLNSFVCGVHLEGNEANEKIISYPIVEPFSYSADVSRLGERFGGFLKGMEVIGLGQPTSLCPDLASVTSGNGLAFHMGVVQVDMLMQLSVMILAPPYDGNATPPEEKSDESTSSSESETVVTSESDPSSFDFPLTSATLVLFEETRFAVSGIEMRYKADGTVCSIEAAKMEYESDTNGQAAASQVLLTTRPNVKITVGCIEHFHIPDTVLLSNPIQSCEISYSGSTMTLQMDTLNIVTFSKKKEGAQTGPLVSAPTLPCNLTLSVKKGMQIKKSEDGSLTKIGRLNLYALKEESCTKVAIEMESFRNYLVSLNTTSFCGSLPTDQVDTIRDFIFAAADVKVMSGHSTDEWSEAFQPRKQKVKQSTLTKQPKGKQTASSKQTVLKLPFATIAEVKLVIGLEASNKIGRVKDTTLVIKAFTGKAETTSKHLVNYYTKACLSRAPDFITNAEVLGLNIVDSTTGLWATWAGVGLGLGSAFGAGAGVAAITAVDAIKGSVDAGKRSRKASEEANWQPGDFMRGLVQAAGEATRDGAAKRGKLQGKGNIIDWTFGATSNTTEYVVENKNRLGAAGAGGGGFLLGMALGGPVGAIVGGLVATATTGATLETLDKKLESIEDSKEDSKTKSNH